MGIRLGDALPLQCMVAVPGSAIAEASRSLGLHTLSSADASWYFLNFFVPSTQLYKNYKNPLEL